MPKFVYVQPVYHYFEVEADSAAEAYAKLEDLTPEDEKRSTVGDWELVETK